MTTESSHNLFERLADQPFASDGIRPGGLGLTRRALFLSMPAPGDAALDIGCGTGVTVNYLIREHALAAVGVDSSSLLTARGKGRDATLPLVGGDAHALPFADNSFHGVFLECMLSLVLDREQVLRECRRVLKPFGKIIVTDLYARNPDALTALRNLPARSCLRGALDKDRFLRECSAGGFDFVCFEDHSDLLRDFAVRMIWEYGSLDIFRTRADGRVPYAGEAHDCFCEAQPGYFLFLGRNTKEPA